MSAPNADKVSSLEKAGAAVFYGLSSIAVIFLNKIILSEYKFGDYIFLSLSQFISTVTILFVLHVLRRIEIPTLTYAIFLEISPVAGMFMGNVVSGLGSTKALSIPMFTVLRRFSIMMTMIGEYVVLSKAPDLPVLLSVSGMIFGALVAAATDLAFDAYGYALVFTNNLFTALSGVYLKKASSSVSCSKTAVLFYNSLLSALALLLFYGLEHMYVVGQEPVRAAEGPLRRAAGDKAHLPAAALLVSSCTKVLTHPAWADPHFVALFVFSATMGSVLNYSIFLCTSVNSALTTAVVGCLKNILTTYVGMVFFSGYTFSWLNFAGINISVAASLYYTFVTLKA